MYLFFQCVVEAVAEKGLRGLAEMVPGGGAAVMIAGPTIMFGASPIWFAVLVGLVVGAIISGLNVLVLSIIRDVQKRKQDEAVAVFAAAHAERNGYATSS